MEKTVCVYNCSFQYQGHNLNELLLPGPPLGPSLLSVLLRFREHALAFSSDIRGMFHQVRLLQSDKPLLRFLWRDLRPENPPSVYEWQVLPFGTTCSPCCATFALQKHVQDHSQPGEDVQVIIEKSFYVDNCLHSLTSREAARVLVDKLRHLLAEGGFELSSGPATTPPSSPIFPLKSGQTPVNCGSAMVGQMSRSQPLDYTGTASQTPCPTSIAWWIAQWPQ
ncbi:hypothetical protein D5F01_LYC24614 [Larimichthys crocea]|uniref:ribonuclease H n=1 Tax=Larimichthys crocea TaxID=215358 RepID=A0A6G0HEJ4_LARCR|nr:hypothetical protein D5F01_LYC24614 [Larimichthys crocea]